MKKISSVCRQVRSVHDNRKCEINRKKVIWAVLSFLIAIGSIAMVIGRSKEFRLEDFRASLQSMNRGWVLLAIMSMFGFIWFEGQAILRIAKTLNITKRPGSGLVYGAADVYFSAITPSASGGQPASAYFMIRDGMNGSAVAITLLFNLVFYCVALLSIAALNFCFFGNILSHLSIRFNILYCVGLVILIGLSVLFYLLIQQGKLIYRLGDWLIGVGEKMKLVRDGKKRRRKLLQSMEQYHACAGIIAGDRRVVRDVFFYNVLQRISQLGVSFFLFMAWKKDWLLALKAVAVQCFVAVGSNSIPIPGAMGVADYMMINGFTHLLGESMAVNMELICRGITFYGCVITGGIITIIGYIRRKRENVGIL
ncbi:MAG: lysylphosphatidylglycerol synthase transmembrane domain-containing protein [Eubacteriales bacterium]|nr:lysylphosphatidylglycerol synthase transmembrane domain-containing protein [Eubacteriales bacterium]